MTASTAKKKIVVIGSSNTDMVIRAPQIPRPGETMLGGGVFMAPGGQGHNQAVGAAQGGGEADIIPMIRE